MESLKKISSNVKDVMKKMAMTESALKSSITETVEKEIKTLVLVESALKPAIKETMEEMKTCMEVPLESSKKEQLLENEQNLLTFVLLKM